MSKTRPFHMGYLWVFLWIVPCLTYSQSTIKLEELYSTVNAKSATPLEIAMGKIDLANHYIYHDLDSATIYINEVLKSEEQGEFIFPDTFHKHLLIKAWTHQGREEYTEAKMYIYKAMDIADRKKSRDDRLELTMNLGSLLVQTRDPSTMEFVDKELLNVDTTLSKADYIVYAMLHQYKSQAYAQKEDYENAIKSLLEISGAAFLKKIPNYKYGIRSSLSQYIAFMGDEVTAAKQLQAALQDTLYKHQEKQVYYDLSLLQLKLDSIATAEEYLASYQTLTNQSNVDKRDYYYLSSSIARAKGEYDMALLFIDSTMSHQHEIQNNQKLLDAVLLKAMLSERKSDIVGVNKCIQLLDSLIEVDNSLATTINMSNISRIRLLHKFLQLDPSMSKDFADYEASHSKWVKKKIDPKLVAAVLDFDNEEKTHQINQLTQTNAAKDYHLEKQSTRLNFTFGFLFLLTILSLGLYKLNLKRKRNNEIVIAEKEVLEKRAEEKRELAEKALADKKRLGLVAAAERKRLEDQQNELKSRMSDIEQSKLDLEKQLLATRMQERKDSITINSATKVHKIKIDQLMYVTAEKDGTRFYLKEKSFWVIMSLKEVLGYLPEESFVKIFRSTVVNVDFISAVNSKYIVLENGEELTMGRTYRDEVKGRVG